LDQLDLDTILRQMQSEVQTRKLLIVGHSQGAEYANKIYEYLIAHGEPADAVGVYAVATPDSYVAGGGKYLNFEGDTTIYGYLASKFIHPLPPNVSSGFYWTSTTTDEGSYQGHGFISEYLATFPDLITSDIKSELYVLRPTNATDTGTCFTAPPDTAGEKAESAGLGVADFYSNAVAGIAQEGYNEASVALDVGGKALAAAGDAFGTVASIFTAQPKTADNTRGFNDTIFAAVKAIYGSSLDVKDVDQLQGGSGKNLGGAAILAFSQDDQGGEVLGSSTEATGTTEAIDTTSAITSLPTPPVPPQGFMMTGDSQSASPPTTPPDSPPSLTAAESFAASPPAISYSNWRGMPGSQLCQVVTRTVDISWSSVPNAIYYEIWATGQIPTNVVDFLVATTTSTSFPNFTFVNAGPLSTFVTSISVVARDAAGDSATTTSVISSALADQQGPSAIDFSPAIRTTNIAVASNVVLTFDEPLATSTVTNDNFYLYQLLFPADQLLVPVTVSLSQDGTTVTLVPQQPLQYATGYRLAFSCAITDLVGNHPPFDVSIFSDLTNPYFTTEDVPSP
jgi:hypothetical protein